MRRKIILTLFGFLLFFIACRNEEVYTSYETQKQELISKSLWKEDLVYIKNVKKVFESDFDQPKFLNKFGLPSWEYAMSFGNFDESFLQVPIIKNRTVESVMQVVRNKKNNKIYFSHTEDKSSLDFFQKLIFSSQKKNPKPDKEIPNPNYSDAGRVLSVETCTTRVYSTLETGCVEPYQNSENCQPIVGYKYVTTCTTTTIYLIEDDPAGWTGDNNGGHDYPTGGGGTTNETTTDPCEKAKTENTEAKSLLEKTDVKSQKEKLTKTIKTDENEKSFSFGKNDKGEYKPSDIKVGTNGNSVSISATNADFTVEGAAHTHTPSLYDCFSAGDFYAFHGANSANSNFKYLYVFSEDAGYVMTITNLEKFKKFTENYPMDDYFDKNTGDWKKDTSIYNTFDNAFKQFINSGKDEDLAFEYATAMVMSKYDMGISLSKQDSSGNFGSVFVKENQIPIQIMPGVIIPISSFQKIDDCNLK